jgi:hypothetical protein
MCETAIRIIRTKILLIGKLKNNKNMAGNIVVIKIWAII